MKTPTNDISEKSFHCFLVEDDDDHADLIQKAITSLGIDATVDRACNGTEAMAYFKQDSHPRPDLIILDLKLPDVEGHEIAVAIKSNTKLRMIPIVVLTTSRAIADRAKAYEGHVNSYLVKPLDFDEFNQMIEGMVRYWYSWNQTVPENQQTQRLNQPSFSIHSLDDDLSSHFNKRIATVLLIEDNPAHADLTQRSMAAMKDMDFDVIHCSTIDDAHQALADSDINVILLDYRIGLDSGLDFLREIRAAGHCQPVVVLTGQGNEQIAVEMLHAGAIHYLAKDTLDQQQFVAVISKAIELDQRNKTTKQKCANILERLASLTEREREVLDLVISGCTTKEIARKFYRSENTIKSHRASLMDKMKAKTPADLTRMVMSAKQTAAGQE